ncbi:MAG: DUF4190 domain-containing protein [Mycobacterium sp.]
MTSQAGGYGEPPEDNTPPFGRRAEPQPWQQYPHAPVDPRTVNYPEYPPSGPHFGYAPPPGYGGPPPYYPGPYDPYHGYPTGPQRTNGLAVASLVTSIAGVVLGIPLALFCYVGVLIPIVGAVLGGVALGQIKRTNQPGHGLAIAGLAIGATTTVILVILIAVLAAAVQSLRMLH